MEGSGNRSGGPPEVVDLEEELQVARNQVPDPVELVELEAEEDDDDIIILDDNLEVQGLRADSPEIVIFSENHPRPEVIDLGSDSDSDIEIVEVRQRSPLVVSLEEEEEENVPESCGEEIESKEEGAAVVSSPTLETSKGFSLSSVKEELGEPSSSTFSIGEVKKEMDVQPLGDVTSLAESLGQVAIGDCENRNSSSSEDKDADSSRQPSSSSSASLNTTPPVNLAHQSEEVIRGPLEREGEYGKTRIAYLPKPDYSSLSEEDKLKLREQMLQRISELKDKCKFGEEYQRRFPPDFIKMENGYMSIVRRDKEGVLRKVIFKPAECRDADEKKADPAFELPPRPTPTYLELLLQDLRLNEGASKKEEVQHKGANKKEEVQHKGASKKEEAHKYKFLHSPWDSQEDVDDFCKNFLEASAIVAKEREEKKKAKEAARLLEKENRKKAKAAMLAKIEQGDRKKTRLATGAITRKSLAPKQLGLGHQSPQTSSALPRGQPQKRKGSEMGSSSGTEITPVPTLSRPSSQPEPSVLKVPSPPPPSSTSEQTEGASASQPAEERPPTCPLENDAGWIKEDVWQVEGVVDVRVEKDDSGKDRIMYKVKWREWGSEHNSWVPEKDILSKAPIATFWRRFKAESSKLNSPVENPPKRGSRSNIRYFLP